MQTFNPQSKVWIGARDHDVDGVWEWTDGSNFDFSYWMSGQPDGGSKYDYGVMDCLYSSSGEWSLLYFAYDHDYICQLTL